MKKFLKSIINVVKIFLLTIACLMVILFGYKFGYIIAGTIFEPTIFKNLITIDFIVFCVFILWCILITSD